MIVSTRNKARTYTADAWIIGAANFTDGDPNVAGAGGTGGDASVTALTALGRIITPSPKIFMMSGVLLSAAIANGTSASIRFWWYDDVQKLWIPFTAAQAVTYAGSPTGSVTIGCMPGAKFYAQVTINVGVTKIAFQVR